MNPYSIPPAIAAILCFILLGWVYSASPSGPVRRVFMAWTFLLGLWNAWLAVGYNLTQAADAYFWYKYLGALTVRPLTPLFLHFVMAVTGTLRETPQRWILRAAYLSGLLFALTDALTPFLMVGVQQHFWGFYPKAAPGDALFGIWFFALVLYSYRLLRVASASGTLTHRNQMKHLMYGLIICFGSGFTNFLPVHGVAIYPVGNLVNSLYTLLIAYAMVEHGLLDVRQLLRRGTVYGLMSGGLTAVYLSFVVILQRLFGHYGIEETLAFYTAAFPLTVILAPAMKSRLEPFVEQTLFRSGGESSPHFAGRDMEIMGMLASQMAHELAKPLTHIMNESARLESKVHAASRKSLDKITNEAQRVSEILDGFALLSPGRSHHRITYSLEEVFKEVLSSLGIEDSSSFHIVRRFETMPPVVINPGQIAQVFTNVIQNACQAMPEGGRLTLSLSTQQDFSGRSVAVAGIEDTGHGIPAAIQDRVFDAFFSTKKEFGGHGVGLTISRAMVERHGGSIVLESPLKGGAGTCVTIRIPLENKEPSHAG